VTPSGVAEQEMDFDLLMIFCVEISASGRMIPELGFVLPEEHFDTQIGTSVSWL